MVIWDKERRRGRGEDNKNGHSYEREWEECGKKSSYMWERERGEDEKWPFLYERERGEDVKMVIFMSAKCGKKWSFI